MSDSLKTDRTIDKHLHMLKTESGEISSLSVSTEGNGAKVSGDLIVTGGLNLKTEGTLNANKIQSNNSGECSIEFSNDIHLNSVADIDLLPVRHINLHPSGETGAVKSNRSIHIKEQSSASGEISSHAQIWVKDDTPNELAFTDDAGTDIVGIGKYQYETKVIGWYNTGTTQVYLPITGGTGEQTGTSSRNEFIGMVAPFNGTIERAMFRCETAQDGTLEFDIYEASDGSENPGSVTGVVDTVIDIADDTSVTIDFSSMTSGTNALVKGRIYAFRVDTPDAPYDSNMTLVFKWDITS